MSLDQGAAAILHFSVPNGPLAQPRNLVFGHLLSATLAIGIGKGVPTDASPGLIGVLGALATALAALAMVITKTPYPPGGATALLAVTSSEVRGLGWTLLLIVTIGNAIMIAVGIVINNVHMRWPLYWWSEQETGAFWKSPVTAHSKVDLEKGESSAPSTARVEVRAGQYMGPQSALGFGTVVFGANGISELSWLSLSQDERIVLGRVLHQLRSGHITSNDGSRHHDRDDHQR